MVYASGTVRWYSGNTGVRLNFGNGYSISIIPVPRADGLLEVLLEVAVMYGDEFADDSDPEYYTPIEIGDIINKVRDLPAKETT